MLKPRLSWSKVNAQCALRRAAQTRGVTAKEMPARGWQHGDGATAGRASSAGLGGRAGLASCVYHVCGADTLRTGFAVLSCLPHTQDQALSPCQTREDNGQTEAHGGEERRLWGGTCPKTAHSLGAWGWAGAGGPRRWRHGRSAQVRPRAVLSRRALSLGSPHRGQLPCEPEVPAP